ncbi:MAG: hypothetical protein HQL31_04435 [Planctomycetes bacterium]|nr:hypothetical protein [Planctomycetota bacterium]
MTSVRPYNNGQIMAHFHTKIKKGRPYLYVREMGRVHGKVKVLSQVYIGSPERVASLAADSSKNDREFQMRMTD